MAVAPEEIGTAGVAAIEFAFIGVCPVRSQEGLARDAPCRIFSAQMNAEPSCGQFAGRAFADKQQVRCTSGRFGQQKLMVMNEWALADATGDLVGIARAKTPR